MGKKHPSGAKAHHLFSAICGPTEVVPFYKTLPNSLFFAACLAVPKMLRNQRRL
jgi:hypothetical protein